MSWKPPSAPPTQKRETKQYSKKVEELEAGDMVLSIM